MSDPLGPFITEVLQASVSKNGHSLSDIDPLVLNAMREELTEQANLFINQRLVEAIPEKSMPEFERLIDVLDEISGSEEAGMAVGHFFETKIPGFQVVLSGAMREFAELYLGTRPSASRGAPESSEAASGVRRR